jgi:hypothetical protein
MSYIVECSTCGQPWAVPAFVLSTREVWIQVPEHEALTDSGVSTGVPCAGVWSSGVSIGLRDDWEKGWLQRHRGRPMPQVLEGDGIRSVRV